jgi:hypothetical protein
MITESNTAGHSSVGSPRKIWINAVEIDSREIWKVGNWKSKSLDREIWSRHLKEAKARFRAVVPKKMERNKNNSSWLLLPSHTHSKSQSFSLHTHAPIG